MVVASSGGSQLRVAYVLYWLQVLTARRLVRRIHRLLRPFQDSHTNRYKDSCLS